LPKRLKTPIIFSSRGKVFENPGYAPAFEKKMLHPGGLIRLINVDTKKAAFENAGVICM